MTAALPSPPARAYILAVVCSGAIAFVIFFPRTLPQPGLFTALLLLSCVTSLWKVNHQARSLFLRFNWI